MGGQFGKNALPKLVGRLQESEALGRKKPKEREGRFLKFMGGSGS